MSNDEPIRLGGRYELGALLGRGGMADVRLGRDLRLGRSVAIKQLRADLAADDTFQERFRREAQSAASLNHPAIVAVYDTGEAPGPHGHPIPYIVMEYVEGQTLREVLRDGRKILPQRALDITAEILSALDYSHRAGIVHRDIKPANVMLTPTGQVKVMDFGIARAIADASSAMTQTAAVIGTAQYLSPEQARGETVDARSDIYSTGCVLYELLTGRPPFVGESPVSVAYQHVREEAKPPSQLNPDVSASVDNVVARALAKRVDDRYQSAADMRADIERVQRGLAVDAPAATALAGATQAIPAATAVTPAVGAPAGTRKAEPEEKGGQRKWWAIGIVAVVLLALAGWGIFKATEEDPPPPVETVQIEDVTGRTAAEARTVLENQGLTIAGETQQASNDVEEGSVVATDPPAGQEVEEGTGVTLVVSTGPAPVTLRDFQGLSYGEAKKQLEAQGLKAEREFIDNSAPRGQVVNSDPGAGQQVEPGSTVRLLVSKGQVNVPDVVNQQLEQAIQTLVDAGFDRSKIRTQDDPNGTAPDGQVTAQSIGSGQQVSPDSEITLTVSRPPETTPPPATDGGDEDGDGLPDVPTP
ncbi:Stk1 family PASTA domain-containing Ser/Thr kinase [Aeromicrobium sp. IC_218]|uniref:Stk1 family PASTA domain-containing Ser/Thr kinase n=1 Tax=Aeromicrobium sp. IC_218 TaxID=2545468 RepID=UPI0010401C24|nr:Stk1 family PASTA domain-containing Ser/Thr kinase [Aeromicrobium sp. IC_218]TCI99297.1 Stk1 family PASTA domain-containing Ser/Thr kinase [Aeromicrobium sp. IC_218]